jgi:Transposase IS66 family
MNRSDITKTLDKINQDIEAISDGHVKSVQKSLLNLIETLLNDNEKLRTENQQLRDENNRLKGEQGKPDIRKQTKPNQDISSEKERTKNKKKKSKKKKKNRIQVNRVEICTIDKDQLPEDAIFKGYEPVIVQDIIIQTDNIKFKKATYYSPSLHKTFMASLPPGYSGEFGPRLRQLVITLYHESNMTQSGIAGFLANHEILIGSGSISRILTQSPDKEGFHQEKKNIVMAGLGSADYQQMDDTSARVKGQNYYDHILCNEFYTAHFTRPHKDRLTIIDILTQGQMKFTFNEYAFLLMKEMKLPEKWLNTIETNYAGQSHNRPEMDNLLRVHFPNPNEQQTNRLILLESTAIAAYQSLPHAVKFLLTDDAPQYNKIAAHHPLCWVHDGRHYKKLMPVVISYRTLQNTFLTKYWNYYDQLLAYKSSPTQSEADRLSIEFDALFSTQTDYAHLNERIEKTKAKKSQLLLVLANPFLPLHNNDSELGARGQARKRDISFHTMSTEGTQAKDTFMTLMQTAKKLTVNFYHYVGDRIKKKYEMPSLANLIMERNKNMLLDTS